MTKATLSLISRAMKEMGIEYALAEYRKSPVVYPYFVGEYQEFEATTSDGLQESTFILTGFSRGSWLDLENAKEKIAKYFGRVSAKTVILDNGSGVAVSFSDSQIVPTGDAELKRIQINLNVKEWMVN